MSDPEIVGVLDFSSARRPIVWVSIPKFHVEDLDYTYGGKGCGHRYEAGGNEAEDRLS